MKKKIGNVLVLYPTPVVVVELADIRRRMSAFCQIYLPK